MDENNQGKMDQETFLTILSRDTGVKLDVLRQVFAKTADYLATSGPKDVGIDEQAWERIKPGQKLLLEVPNGKVRGKYVSQIVRRGQHTVYVAIPRNDDGLVKMPPDTPMVVRFQNEDIIVGFKAVSGGYLQTEPPSFNLNLLGGLIIKSLRKFPRAKSRIVCDIEYFPPGKEGAKEMKKAKGLIKDISAGGVRLGVGQDDVGRGQVLYLTFQLSESETMQKIQSEVVYLSERSKEQLECGVQFKKIEAAQRDLISEWVAKQLLE